MSYFRRLNFLSNSPRNSPKNVPVRLLTSRKFRHSDQNLRPPPHQAATDHRLPDAPRSPWGCRHWWLSRFQKHSFVLQELPLDLKPAPEADQRTIFSDHPMAGHDDRDRIRAIRRPHCTHRFWVLHIFGQLPVTTGLPKGCLLYTSDAADE